MIIETKYNSGNKVFVLINNGVRKCTIANVEVRSFDTKSTDKPAVYYTLKCEDNLVWVNGEFIEERLYNSKEELIKSL